MRDEHYRQLCDTPRDYDAVIDWIRDHNSASSQDGAMFAERDEWASNAVNIVIRSVVFSVRDDSFVSTGMAMATRLSQNPNSPNYKKVVLSINLMYLALQEQIVRGGDNLTGTKPYILAPGTDESKQKTLYYVETEQANYGANTLDEAMRLWRSHTTYGWASSQFGMPCGPDRDLSTVINIRRAG